MGTGSVGWDDPGAGRVGGVEAGRAGGGFVPGVGVNIGAAGRGGEFDWRALAEFGAEFGARRRRVVSNGTLIRCHADSKA